MEIDASPQACARKGTCKIFPVRVTDIKQRGDMIECNSLISTVPNFFRNNELSYSGTDRVSNQLFNVLPPTHALTCHSLVPADDGNYSLESSELHKNKYVHSQMHSASTSVFISYG